MIFADEFNNTFFGTRQEEEITVIGTVQEVKGGYYEVSLNDSDTTTKCTRTVTASEGDRVMCKVKNGIVTIIGNLTNPSADSVTVEQHDVFIGDLGANEITAGQINAATAVIKQIGTDDLIANQAYIEDLTAKEITADQIEAATAFVSDLQADNIDAANIIADHAAIADLDADMATIARAEIGNATIKQAQVENLSTSYAAIDFANVNTANITEAWVKDLMSQGKVIAQDGTFYKLTGLHIDAGDITAGTLTVDHIAVQGSDGEYYMLSPKSDGTFEQVKLNGNIIQKNSLNADRITAHTITADQITANNLVGTGGWINLANGTFEYNNATTKNFIKWDGSKLTMNVTDLKIGASDVATMAAVESKGYLTVDSDAIRARVTNDEMNRAIANVKVSNKQYGYPFVINDGGDANIINMDIAGRAYKWNSICDKSAYSVGRSTGQVSFASQSDGGVKITVSATNTGFASYAVSNAFSFVSGHKYLFAITGESYGSDHFNVMVGNSTFDSVQVGANGLYSNIYTATSADASNGKVERVYINVRTNCPAGTYTIYPRAHDLTDIYGAGNEPTTVAQFRADFPDAYYPYDAGSVKVVEGKNLLDEALPGTSINVGSTQPNPNYFVTSQIPVFPGESMTISGRTAGRDLAFFDASKNYVATITNVLNGTFSVPAGAYFMRTNINYADKNTAQLERGSVATPYVPYGSIEVRSDGRNLLGGWEKGSFVSTNGSFVSTDNRLRTDYISVKAGTYMLSTGADSISFNACVYDGNKNFVMSPSPGVWITDKTKQVKVDKDGFIVVACHRNDEVISNVEESVSAYKMQLERGYSANPYTPYVPPKVSEIPLNGNVAASLPDGTTDDIIVDGAGRGKLVKRVGVVNLATLNFTYVSSNKWWQSKISNAPTFSTTALAEKYTARMLNGYFLAYDDVGTTSPSGYGYYPLAEPYEIDLGMVEVPRTLEGHNTVTVDAAIEPSTMSVEYVTKAGKALSEQSKAMSEAAIEVSKDAIRSMVFKNADGTIATQSADGFTWELKSLKGDTGDAGSSTIYYGHRDWNQWEIDNYGYSGYTDDWNQTVPGGVAARAGDTIYIAVTNTETGKNGLLYIRCTKTTTASQNAEGVVVAYVDGPQGSDGNNYVMFTTNYNYNQADLAMYSAPTYSGTWTVNESVSRVKVGDSVQMKVINRDKGADAYIIGTVIDVPRSNAITVKSTGLLDAGAKGNTGAAGADGLSSWTPMFSSSKITRTGSSFKKTGGTDGVWDTHVYSKEGYVTATATAVPGQTNLYAMFGLNSDPETNENYSSIDYAWYPRVGGDLQIYENGTSVGSFGTYTTTTVLTITYDGTNVVYYANGVAKRTVARASGTPLYFDSSFYSNSYVFNNVTFAAYGQKGAAGKTPVKGTDYFTASEISAIEGNAATAAANSIEIGGRNYCPYSRNLAGFLVESSGHTRCERTDEFAKLIAVSQSTANYGIYRDVPVDPNTDYVLSFNLSSIAGAAKVGVGREGSLWGGIINYGNNLYTEDGRKELRFNSGSYTYVRLYFTLSPATNSSYMVSKVKLENGTKATDWTENPDDLVGGGTNLLSKYVCAGFGAPAYDGSGGNTQYYGEYGIKIPATNADTYFRLWTFERLTAGDVYTLSCDVSGLNAGTRYTFPIGSQANTSVGMLWVKENGRAKITFCADTTQGAESSADGRKLYAINMDDYGRTLASGQGAITLTNFKLERGGVATDWTPAPEDVELGISNAAKTATNYMNFDANGLVIGNKESGSFTGFRTQLQSGRMDILNSSGTSELAIAPGTVRAGLLSGHNTIVDSDGFHVRNNGKILASYKDTSVELAKGAPSGTIDFCDGGLSIVGQTFPDNSKISGANINTNGWMLLNSTLPSSVAGTGRTVNSNINMQSGSTAHGRFANVSISAESKQASSSGINMAYSQIYMNSEDWDGTFTGSIQFQADKVKLVNKNGLGGTVGTLIAEGSVVTTTSWLSLNKTPVELGLPPGWNYVVVVMNGHVEANNYLAQAGISPDWGHIVITSNNSSNKRVNWYLLGFPPI